MPQTIATGHTRRKVFPCTYARAGALWLQTYRASSSRIQA